MPTESSNEGTEYITESELKKLELPLSHTSHSAYEQIPKHGRETTLDTNAVVAAFPSLAATLREAVRLLSEVDTKIYVTTRYGHDSVSYCPICKRYGTNDNCIVHVDHADDCYEGQRDAFLATYRGKDDGT